MEEIVELIRKYAEFFAIPPRREVKNGVEWLHFPLTRAIGWTDVIPPMLPEEITLEKLTEVAKRELEELKEDSPELIMQDARELYLNKFITRAHFYYFIQQARWDHSLEEINRRTIIDFGINPEEGELIICRLPQRQSLNPGRTTTIFLYLDKGTELDEVNDKVENFLDVFVKSHYTSSHRSYSLVLIVETYDLARKLSKVNTMRKQGVEAICSVPLCTNYHPPLKDSRVEGLENMYTKPSFGHENVPRIVTDDMRKAVIGELYTGLCRYLKIDSRDSILITDSPPHLSIDNSTPLITLAIPKGTNADVWLDIINTFEELGNGSIYSGAIELNCGCWRPRGLKDIRRYEPIEKVELFRLPNEFPNCYFLDHPPEFEKGRMKY